MSVCLSVCVWLCLSVSVCVSVSVSVSVSVCLSIYLSKLSICTSIYLSIYLPIYVSTSLPASNGYARPSFTNDAMTPLRDLFGVRAPFLFAWLVAGLLDWQLTDDQVLEASSSLLLGPNSEPAALSLCETNRILFSCCWKGQGWTEAVLCPGRDMCSRRSFKGPPESHGNGLGASHGMKVRKRSFMRAQRRLALHGMTIYHGKAYTGPVLTLPAPLTKPSGFPLRYTRANTFAELLRWAEIQGIEAMLIQSTKWTLEEPWTSTGSTLCLHRSCTRLRGTPYNCQGNTVSPRLYQLPGCDSRSIASRSMPLNNKNFHRFDQHLSISVGFNSTSTGTNEA